MSIIPSNDGGYVMGGWSASDISRNKSENMMGGADYWILKTDSIGDILWENTIGGINYSILNAIQQVEDGKYILGGHSESNISGDKTENCFGINDYWIIKLTDQYNLISGKLFSDFNSNSVQDLNEPSLKGRKISDQNTGRFTFSDDNGNYRLSVLDSGNFSVSLPSIIWYSSVPFTHSATFTDIKQVDSLNDFAFQPQGVFEDVCVTITPMGAFRSGFTASYMINYGNYGTTTVAPTVYFYPYNNVTYQSATLTPNNITLDSVVWNLPALIPFQTGSIIVTVNVNLGLPIGTLINSSAHIEPYLTDDNPSCNNSNWEVYTTGSFDPNDILVSEDTLTTTQLSNAPWLDYIIRFQNTGNDTAFTVKILNPIDTNKLNISSIEFVNSSHPVNLNWINYQRNMEFKFENILLPDSNTNEPLSHGFVRYRIQPKTNLNVGDTIPNFAAIYFDFNEPVITNTAKTIIVLPTGLASATPALGKLHVFPNPTENTLNVSGIQLENGKAQLRLIDIYGKLILEKIITSTATTIETNNLSNGIYLIQSGELRATFVKQ
jgi:Secretion system C-terminal sorting domain